MKLFVYGTLMDKSLMMELLHRKARRTTYQVKNYARYALKNRSYPGLIHMKGATTSGILYQDLKNDDLRILDEYEGGEYERIEVDPGIQTYLYIGSKKNLLDHDWPHKT